jgi:hypothetical protein
MAQDYLYISWTGTVGGGNWSLRGGGSLRTRTTTDSDATGPQHQCNTGSGRSTTYWIDDFSSAASAITSLSIYHRHRRTGVTDNAKSRNEIGRPGYSDWTGPLRTSVNSVFNDTITAPGSGWTDTIVDGIDIQWYHSKGADTSSNYLYFDYIQIRVNYTPAAGSVTIWQWLLPWAFPFVEDLAKAINFYVRRAPTLCLPFGGPKHLYTLDELRMLKFANKYRTFHFMGGEPCLT